VPEAITAHHDVTLRLKASTGAELWSHSTACSFSSSPAVANGVVYVGSTDGN
jgi:outer membrane protein assembly factor BamB